MGTSFSKIFWINWLVVASAGWIIFGLCMLLLPDVMQLFFNRLFKRVLAADLPFSPAATDYINFTYGVLGAVMVGWFTSLLLIALGSFSRGEQAGWQTIATSIGLWFTLDTTYSLCNDYAENALLNLLAFAMFAIPLGATYRKFYPPSE